MTVSVVVTGQGAIPTQVYKGKKMPRVDLESNHEEADITLVQQLLSRANDTSARLTAECDDTDIFVELVYFYSVLNLECDLIMESPIRDRPAIDIGATSKEHADIASDLPALHAVTGCDTVAATYGIGKATAIKIAKKGFKLSSFGKLDAQIDIIENDALSFMAAC